jgi:hypothetical protein
MLIFKPRALFGALILLSTLASEPAHAFGKRPVVPDPPSTPNVPSTPGDVIRARWETKTRDGVLWSQHVYNAIPTIAPNLLSRNPADVAHFCPAYASLSASDKKNFWVYLLSGLTELESDFNPAATFTENFRDQNGRLVESVGLLQLSIGDAAIYGCRFRSTADMEDPYKNLDCGLKILNRWVGSDRAIGGRNGAAFLGGARYWSTLRAPKLSTVEGWTRALRMCGN